MNSETETPRPERGETQWPVDPASQPLHRAATGPVVPSAPKSAEWAVKRNDPGGRMPQLLRVFAPLIQHLAGYSQLLPLPVIRDRYAHKLERAGLGFELSADEFLAIKVMTALVMIVVAFITYTLLVHSWLVVLALIATGFMLPDMRLSAAVARQERAYLRSLPGFLDLLALSVEAGLSFDSAVRRLTEILEPGPLIQGFQTYLRNTNIGKSRADALREMARKADLPDLTAFTNAVIQATETGASMGQVLRTESHEMLLRRFERAEKAAYELPVKILFPLFAFVFPATFLMILGPLYFQFKASGAGGIF